MMGGRQPSCWCFRRYRITICPCYELLSTHVELFTAYVDHNLTPGMCLFLPCVQFGFKWPISDNFGSITLQGVVLLVMLFAC